MICTQIVCKFYSAHLFGVSPNICIDIHIEIHSTAALLFVDICIHIHLTTASIFTLIFPLKHCTSSIAYFFSESHLISASAHICINICINIQSITESPDIHINISINIHGTTASICIDIFSNIQPTTESPNICIGIPQLSPKKCINLHLYLH